ncbi:MAG: DUF4129 domain-containing protein [Candidatus Saliniplasma sp.]
METLKRQTLLTLAVVTFLIGAWLVGNVMFILPTATERTAHTEFEIEDEGTGGEGSASLSLTGETFKYIYFSIVLFLVSITVIASLRYGTKRGMKLQLGAIVTIVVVTIFYLYSMGFISSLPTPISGASGRIPYLGEDGRVSQIVSRNRGVFILTLLSGAIFVLLGLVKLKGYLVSDNSMEGNGEFEADMSDTVEEAIRGLYKGKDVNSTIIRCYQNMCYILEGRGVSNDVFITPRELQNKTVERLDISEEIISELTGLFEKGRYSFHKMDECDRERALKDLKELKKELEDKEDR